MHISLDLAPGLLTQDLYVVESDVDVGLRAGGRQVGAERLSGKQKLWSRRETG